MGEETWKDLLSYDQPKGFKPPHWCAVLLEVSVFLIVGVIAALLRFTSWAKLFRRHDFSLLCSDPQFNKEAMSNDFTWLYYTLSIVAPLVMVIACEVERSYYSEDPNYKTFTATQRFFYISLRPIGMFILGIFLLSTISDVIGIEVALPRPYFFTEYKEYCFGLKGLEKLTLDERYALTSFPCHLSTISAFTTYLAGCYIHKSSSLHSVPLLKPTLSICLFLLTVSSGIYRMNINYNHGLDVLCGFAIGIFFGHLVHLVLLKGYKSHKQILTENTFKLLLPRVHLPTSGNQATTNRHTSQSSSRGGNARSQSVRSKPPWMSD